MTRIITGMARAYVNYGRWVADCPVDCGCALALQPGQTIFACQECQTVTQIDWPSNPDEIWEALAERPAPRTRNWFPEGHDLALRANLPHGQTPKELRDETAEHLGG